MNYLKRFPIRWLQVLGIVFPFLSQRFNGISIVFTATLK